MSFLRKKTTAIIGILLMLYGIVLICLKSTLLIYSVYILGALICIVSVIDLLIHQRDLKTKLYLIGSFIIGLIMFNFPYFNLKVLILLFGLFCIGDFIAKMIIFIQYMKNKIKYRYFLLMDAVFYLFGGLICTFKINWVVPKLSIYLGIYLILFGFRFLRDGYEELIGGNHQFNTNRRHRMTIPVMFTALIPKGVLLGIEKAIANHEELDEIHEDVEADVEIMIHTAPSSHNMMGHVDLCFGNTVISYGNYDYTKYRLFDTIGDGVIIVASKDRYIKFSQSYLDKTLVSFGIKFTDEQRQRVDEKLLEIFTNVEPWAPRAKRDPEHRDEYNEYSSMLYKGTGACFYKPKSGRFKSFFIFGTNCVLFADSILGRAGTDILNVNGMITPGNYYDYFNSEFKKKNSLVVFKKVYYMKEQKRKDYLKHIGLKKHGTK